MKTDIAYYRWQKVGGEFIVEAIKRVGFHLRSLLVATATSQENAEKIADALNRCK